MHEAQCYKIYIKIKIFPIVCTDQLCLINYGLTTIVITGYLPLWI